MQLEKNQRLAKVYKKDGVETKPSISGKHLCEKV